jgi:predicted dehydrogenase
MAERLKILFAGLGSIGQRHVRNLRALLGERVELLAYRAHGRVPVLNPDMTVQAGADLASRYGIRLFASLEAGLAERPDAVFVTNPNSLHLPVALAAARAGCHLFIEKPVAVDFAGVAELVAEVERRRLVTLVGYQFRFHPGLRLLREWLQAGRLGQLVGAHIVNAEYLPGWHPYEDYREGHSARRGLGGGCLRVQSHELDYAQWLFGLPESVYAVGGQLSRLEVDSEDSISLLLDCRPQGRALPVHIHLDYLQRPPQRVCEVYGDAGKARYDYYAGCVDFTATADGQLERHDLAGFDRNQMFVDELNHFLACLRGEAEPLTGLREGLRSLAIALAAERSLAEGRPIRPVADPLEAVG